MSVSVAVEKLRDIILTTPDDTLLGSEDSLMKVLGASRPTTRQAARILERDGLLRVRRGTSGGYYGIRPSYGSVESAVSTHLKTLHLPIEQVSAVATALWIETVRRAALACDDTAVLRIEALSKKVRAVKDGVSFEELTTVELPARQIIFDMVQSPYVELIFRINSTFSFTYPDAASILGRFEAHQDFVREWRRAKLLELSAIAARDADVATAAARHFRLIWDRRIREGF